eukprot:9481434-Karenia_brevis.AAC.1
MAWLSTLDSSDSPSDASQEAESPVDPSPLNDTGSSVRNMGPTPFVEDHAQVKQGERYFPEERTSRDLPDVGDYVIQCIGVNPVEEFERKSKKGRLLERFRTCGM